MSDVEEIGAKEAQKGSTSATQTMLSILEKRGPKAYGLFLEVLRRTDIMLPDLADELEEEERKLRGKTGKSPSFLLCLITLNMIEISNYSHAMLIQLLSVGPAGDFLRFRRLHDAILTKIYLDNFLNVMKAIEPKWSC